ncbi:GntR family transcriptional regulator [Georgenia halophila]|uniref:GntR family transcriptional regulator n=1 Tax=Georgenia halophila TaxID=620889 RepID=A0ABP8LMT8_9MICO
MTDTEPRYTLAPSSMIDALYESMRKRIINGDLGPGEKVTEARLSSDYKVARTTAKACLERLTAAGLLRRSAHRSATVPEFDEQEILDLYFTRGAIESAAVVRLAEDAAVPAEARRAQEGVERAAESMVFEEQVEADIAFHAALVDAVGSKRLSRMHELIMGEVHLTMGQFQAHRTARPTTVAAEHAAILQAIDDGDVDRVAHDLSAHLTAARDRLIDRRRAANGA